MKKTKKIKNLPAILITAGLLFFIFFLGGNPANAQTTSVTGTLTLPDGVTTVSSVWISIHNSNWSVSQGTYTNSNGYFSFMDLTTGSYILEVYAYNSSYPNPDPTTVDVTTGQTTSLGVITLMNPNITGRLTLPDGATGIPSIYLYMHNSSWSIYRYAYTDSNGYFNFYTSQSGDYILETWSSYTTGGTTYWPPTATSFTHTAGQTTDLGTVKFNASNIIGTITQPDGVTAVNNIGITVRTGNWSFSRSVWSSSDGSFGLYAPAGSYIAEVYSYDENYPAPAPFDITVVEGQTTDLGVVKLADANVIGKLTKADGTTAVSGASVTLHNGNWSVSKWKSTSSDGIFRMFLSTSGSYTIEVWANDSQESNPDPINFTFTAGQTSYFDGTNSSSVIKLQAPAMRGQILKPDSIAAAYASVNVHDSSYSWQGSKWASTDSNGYFKVDALPTGTYKVEITPPWDCKGIIGPEPFDISLTKGVTNTDYLTNPITLIYAKKAIVGTVKKPDGTVITDAYVNTWKSGGGYGWAQTETDSGGNFAMMVGKGKWQVSIYPKWNYGSTPSWGYYKSPTNVEFTSDNSVSESQTVDFTVLPFTSTLKGYVRYPDDSVPPMTDYVSVSVWSQGGGGNWSQVNSSGYFEMKLPAGTFNVNIYSSNTTYAAPDLTTVTLAENEVLDLGTIKFSTKNEHIKGKITDSNGNPLQNQYVSTWKPLGSGWAWGQTDANGNYNLLVSPGAWMVSAYPSWSGNNNGTTYIATQDPQKVVLTANETKENINFQFAIADATIKGTVQKSDGTVIDDLYAWAFARDANETNGSGNWYSNLGGSVSAGSFEIKVPAGTWSLGVWLPWGSDYSASSETPVTIGSGETVDDAVITVLPNDATITGSMVDSSGNVITDVWGSVFAQNGAGGYQWANITDGTYSMKVAAGTWRVGFWVDWTSGYLNQPPENNKVTIASEETKTFDLLLQKADSTISGTVLDPDGNPLANAWVNADTKFGSHKSNDMDYWWGWNQGKISDKNGKFSIQVPAGEYYVTATLPPDMGYINPEATKVIVDAENSADLTLQFKVADGQISGTVTLNSQANAAFVWGWSEKGGYSEYYSNDGSYVLPVTKNDVWHLGAVYETTNAYYKSNEYLVEVGESGTATQDIVLNSSSISMPAAVTATFSSANAKTIKLDDGTTISIPANSLSATTVDVTVTATPKAQVPTQASAKPIGLAYDFEARYASGANSGQLITSFAGDVSITIPYTHAQLEALGITEDDIAPMYYDEASGTWKNVENVVVDKDNDTITFTAKHFTSFAITTGKVTQTAGITAPTLTVTDPVNNSVVTIDSLLVAGTVSDPTATVIIRLNETSVGDISVNSSTGAFSKTITGLQVGTNTVTVDAIKGTASATTVTRIVTYRTAATRDTEETPTTGATGVELEIVTISQYGGPQVRVFDRHGNLLASFFAYNKNLRGEFSVITADINGDGYNEIIVYAGQGFGSQIRVFDHRGKFINHFFAYQETFRGGISVTTADIDGDGRSDLIVNPQSKGGSNIRVYKYNISKKTFELLDWFMAYQEDFRGKLNLVTSDIDNDNKAEIILAPAEVGGPNVRVYKYNSSTSQIELLDWFWAYQETYRNGVNIGVADVNGDGLKEIVTAPAGHGGPNIRVFQYNSTTHQFTLLDWFWAYQETFKAGVNFKLADVNNDGKVDIITMPTTKGGPNIRVFKYNSSTSSFELLDWFMAYQENFRGGVNLAVSDVDKDGNYEIVTSPKDWGGPNVRLYEYNSSNSQFELLDWEMAFDANFRGKVSVKVADLDGNGDSEIIITPLTKGGPNVRIYDFVNNKLTISKWFMAYAETFRGGVKVTTGR